MKKNIKVGQYLNGKSILISGGTGSFGKKFAETVLKKYKPKKVVIFSVPGAFTPTCSARHLPGFVENFEAFKEKGVDTLANAVKTTMGPKGKLVLIQRGHGHPSVTKDGVTVANAINLVDEVENLGAKVLKEAASRTADEAGDGEHRHRVYGCGAGAVDVRRLVLALRL